MNWASVECNPRYMTCTSQDRRKVIQDYDYLTHNHYFNACLIQNQWTSSAVNRQQS